MNSINLLEFYYVMSCHGIFYQNFVTLCYQNSVTLPQLLHYRISVMLLEFSCVMLFHNVTLHNSFPLLYLYYITKILLQNGVLLHYQKSITLHYYNDITLLEFCFLTLLELHYQNFIVLCYINSVMLPEFCYVTRIQLWVISLPNGGYISDHRCKRTIMVTKCKTFLTVI